MALFRLLWLRRFVRRHTRPMPLDTAARNKQRLSILYMFFAWNAVGFIAYSALTKGKTNWAVFHKLEEEQDSPGMFIHQQLDFRLTDLVSAQSYAKLLKIDNARVIRISGIRKEDEYEIERDTASNEVVRKPISE